MNISLLPLLAALAAPAASAVHSPTLDSLRGLGGEGAPVFDRVKFRLEEAPEPPSAPANLKDRQKDDLVRFLSGGRRTLPKGLHPMLVERLMAGMDAVDAQFKRPIAEKEWSGRIYGMKREFIAKYGDPKNATLETEQWAKAVDAMLVRLTSRLKDPHTQYMDADEMKEMRASMSGSFHGIGANVELINEGIKVEIAPGSPAEAAGLRDGDVIVSVDGTPVSGLSLGEAVGKIRGPAGSQVKLGIAGRAEEIVVTRGEIKSPALFAEMVAPGVGYVHLSAYKENVDETFMTLVDGLIAQGARKLIWDLRFNAGGLLPMADSLASEFLREGQTIRATRTQGVVRERAIATESKYAGMPLAVLINRASASASEISAQALKEHKAAIIVGERSCGKGTFQSVGPLVQTLRRVVTTPRGYAVHEDFSRVVDEVGLRITSGGWESGSGAHFENGCDAGGSPSGVIPDVPVEVPMEEAMALRQELQRRLHGRGTRAAKDTALEKALEALAD